MYFFVIPLLFLAAACGGPSGIGASGGSWAPRVISGNDRSVSVEILPIHNEADALIVADRWCKKYDRSAVLVQDRRGGKFNYQCVQ